MLWPDDESNAKKPRYSAETGNRLLRNKNIDLDNLQNDYIKLKERLAVVSQERDDATNKLQDEIKRLTSLERELLRGKEELARKDDDRANLEAELAAASIKAKEAELEQRQLQHQLEDLSAKQVAGDQRSKVLDLEKTIRGLQTENARLSNLSERPSSRTSSIPVSKTRRPSESKSPRLEEDLRICRAELAEEKAKGKRMETKMRKAEADAIQLQNEKSADAKKAQAQVNELRAALQEAKEDADLLRLEMRSSPRNNVDTAEVERLTRDRASALEQLETTKQDKTELEKRLARKTAQCESLQEKLDNCFYATGDEDLRQELAAAKEELATLKENMEDLVDRRNSLLNNRYELQDRDRKIQSLEEKLRRRESSVADVEAQTKRIEQLIDEKENVKDELRRAQQHNRYVDSQLNFRQQELSHAQTQVRELETALSKARALNNQQQELYSEVVKSCNIAEKRVADVERELFEIRDEMANRSTIFEAQERNRQWEQALERVGQLERQLFAHGEHDQSTSKAQELAPPALTFANESEMDAVASLVIRLQRVREERESLRGSVEFLNLELRAKEITFERQREAHRSQLLRLVQSAEGDIVHLRQDLTSCEARLLQSQQEYTLLADRFAMDTHRTQTISTAALVALQRVHHQLELDHRSSVDGANHLDAQLQGERQSSLETVQKLQSLLKEREDALAELNSQNTNLISEAREKSRGIQELQGRLEELEDARHKLEEMLDEQSCNVRTLERELDARALDYQRLEEAHNIAREELYEARQEADQLRNDHMTELGQENPEARSTLERHIEELDARITRRNEQIGIQQNEARRLDMNLRIAESTVDELRTEVDELRRQVGWLEDDAANVRQERNSAQIELEATRHELDSAQTSVSNQENLLKACEDARGLEIATLVEVISSACVQTRLTTAALDDANARVEELQSLLDDLPDARSQIHPTQVNAQSEELDEARRTIETLSISHQQDSQRLLDYSQQTENLQKALQDAIVRGNTLAEQMRRISELARDEVRERMLSLEDQVGALSGEVESLEERLGEAQQQIQMVLSQNGDLTNQNYELETSVEAAAKEHQEKTTELEAIVQALQAEIEEARISLLNANQASIEELEKLKEELSDAQMTAKGAEELKSRVQTLQQEKTALTEQVSRLSSSINERKMELDGLLRRVAETDDIKRELLQKSEDLQQAEAARSQLEQDLIGAQSNMQHVQHQLSDKTTALQQCQDNLANASEKLVLLRNNISSLETSSAKMERELHEAQQAASAAASTTVRDAETDVRIVQLESIIVTMREEIKELERVLTHKTQEIDDHDDRHIEMLKERKKLVAKVDSLNRKIRMMQQQLDIANDVSPSDDMPLSESVTGSVTVAISQSAPAHVVQSSSLSVHTPLSAPPNYLQPQPSIMSSTTSRRSPVPVPPPVYEQVAPVMPPRTLSSSAPSVPLVATSIITTTPLRTVPATTSLPPSQVRYSTPQITPLHRAPSPPPQTSSSRKRRLPDDFDPSPEAQLPAMPVLSTTPGRLRKVLRDGPLPRTGFTPSRSRKNSAATLDKELASAAAAAVATLNIAPVLKTDQVSEKLPLATLVVKSKSTTATRSVHGGLDSELSKAKPVSDITNTPRLLKPTLLQLPSEPAKADTAPPVRKYKGGWLNRTAKSGTASRNPTTGAAPRRRIVDEPELGSAIVPRRIPVEVRRYPRELS